MPSSDPFTLRPAGPADAGAIAAIQVATWRLAYRGLVADAFLDGMDPDRKARWWARWFADAARSGAVAHVAQGPDGAPVAFAAAGPPQRPVAGYDAELFTLYVLPAWQARGLGRRLLTATAVDLRARGGRALMLWTLAGNTAAQRFYERMGARPTGEQGVVFGGEEYREVGYGWPDLGVLVA